MPRVKKTINPVWNKWDKRVKRLRALVEELKENELINGELWTQKMVIHNNKELKRLTDNQPEKYKT